MKKLLRYSTSVVGIIVGMSIALLSIFFADYMKRLAFLEKCEKERLSYNYQYAFSVRTNSQTDYNIVSDVFRHCAATVIAEDVSLYLNQEYAEHLCRIVYSQEETLNYRLCSGRYPTDAEIETGRQVVILGNALKKYTYSMSDGDYIRICGDEYFVTGYCAGENTTVSNYSILLFAGCLGTQTEMDVWHSGNTYVRTYTLNSNYFIPHDLYLAISEELKEEGIQVGGFVTYISDFDGGQYRESYLNLSYVICIFSLIITLVVIRFWLFQRYYEFTVRRIYGYSMAKLYFLIVKELAALLCISAGFSAILYEVVVAAYYQAYHVQVPAIAISVIPSLLMMVMIIVAAVTFTVWNIFRRSSLTAYSKG